MKKSIKSTKKPFPKYGHAELAVVRNYYDKTAEFLASSNNSRILNLGLLLLIAGMYILRGFTYLAHPQLYAEDGTIWLSGAYNKGLHSIFQSYNGLSHLFDRLFGLFALHVFTLREQPLVYVLSALFIFLLMSFYLLSRRSQVVTTNYQKIFLAVSLCLIGNAEEFSFSFSNSVFLFGIIGVIILVAKPSKYKVVDILEKILFVILCFTNVFSWVFILILAFEFVWQKRRRYFYAVPTLIGAITQALIHIHQPAGQRPDVPLRYIVSKPIAYTFYNQIITPSWRFGREDIQLSSHINANLIFICLVLLLCLAITVYIFLKSNYVVRCLLFFCVLVTLISLKSPIDGTNSPSLVIKILATYYWGNRYFIFGIIGMFVIWAKFTQVLVRQVFLPVFITGFIIWGVLSSLQLNAFYPQRYLMNLQKSYSRGVDMVAKSKSKQVIIPINPGPPWYVIFNPKTK